MPSPGTRAVRRLLLAALPALGVAGGLPRTASGGQVKLGVGDAIAWDQPRTLPGGWLLLEPGTENPVGPGFDLVGAILDTGANGVMVFFGGYHNENFEFDPDMYDVSTRPDMSRIQFREIGAAGEELVDVLVPYDLAMTPNDDPEDLIVIPAVRALGAPQAQRDSFISGLLGMPVMIGRYVHMDVKPLGGDIFEARMRTSFLASKPAAGPRDYTVTLEMLPADADAGRMQAGDPSPTYADLPMLSVRGEEGMRSSTRTMLLDTGAQFSMITTSMAQELGLDLNELRATTDIEGSIPVSGIGGEGSVEAPLVSIDRLVIPTDRGDLVLTDLTVGIIDIPGLGGIFGSNILTSGYIPGFDGPGQVGYFEEILMDFASPTKTLTLTLNPAFDVMADSPRRLTARAPAGGTIAWDTTTLSFDDAGAAVAFRDGDFVTFGAAAAGKTIQVIQTVAPTHVEFNVTGTTPTVLQGAGITGAGGISKLGTGTLRVENSNSFSGRTDVRGGLVHVVAAQDIGSVFVHSTGSLRLSAPQQFARLAVHNGQVTVDPGRDKTLLVGDASVSGAGRIDLADNVMIVRLDAELFDLTGLDVNELVNNLTQRISSGRNPVGSPTWDGFGIASSVARDNPLGTTGLGIMLNSTTGDEDGEPIYSQFMGHAVDEFSILIAYTYAGDLNLDGKVDGDDVMRLDRSFLDANTEGYAAGDINHDGRIDIGDFALMDRALRLQGAPFDFGTGALGGGPAAVSAAVPEPASLVLVGAAIAALTARRRRW